MDAIPTELTNTGEVRTITIPVAPRATSTLAHYSAIIAEQVQQQTPWQEITNRYDVRQMDGPEVVRFAHDLVTAGIDQTEALAVTWPISSRNLMEKIGRAESAPKVDNWDDVLRHHITQRDIAKNRHNFGRVAYLDKLIRLARNFGENANTGLYTDPADFS
jgi:hypothetical protein